MASLSGETKSNESNESNDHACLDCTTTPANANTTNCIHLGKWHSTVSDCSPRCLWQLGTTKLGQQHYSCCYSTDDTNTSCAKNTTHSFAPSPQPTVTASSPLFGIRDCPRYVVDLDAPASERWNHVVADYKDKLSSVVTMTEDILGTGVGATIATSVFATAANVGWVHYSEELIGIAKATGIPLGKVVLLQIAYEAFAACTSIVVNGPDGYPLHIRTMDWEMEELQPLTIEVDFMKSGVLVHRATTWAGYVGVLTGLRANGFSVSVNYRRSLAGAEEGVKGILHNLTRGFAGHWPVSFLLREVMESETTYEGAVAALQQSELMAPVYLTIAGVKKNEGCVLTRDREAAGGMISEQLCDGNDLGIDDGNLSVVQTNMDIHLCDGNDSENDWQDICDSRVRRRFAKAALVGEITMEDLWKLVSVAPCKAHDTVYTTSMVPKTSELVTRVKTTRKQKRAGQKRFGKSGGGGGGGATRQ